MIDGVSYLKLERLRAQFVAARNASSEPAVIESLTEAIDGPLNDLLAAVAREDVANVQPPFDQPAAPELHRLAQYAGAATICEPSEMVH